MSSISLSLTSSSQTIKSAPSIADEEYFLVEKLKAIQARPKVQESKFDSKEENVLAVRPVRLSRNSGSVSRSLGEFKTKLVYDLTITPSTSSALSTSVALSPSQDTTFTDHLRYLFQEVKMDSASLQLDYHAFSNLTGEAGVLPAMAWAWVPISSLTTQTYADVSNYTTARPIRWSPQRPNVTYRVPRKWLTKSGGWNGGQEAVSVSGIYNDWAPTRLFESTAFHRGFIHVAGQAAFGVSRAIVGRLVMNCTFRNRI